MNQIHESVLLAIVLVLSALAVYMLAASVQSVGC